MATPDEDGSEHGGRTNGLSPESSSGAPHAVRSVCSSDCAVNNNGRFQPRLKAGRVVGTPGSLQLACVGG